MSVSPLLKLLTVTALVGAASLATAQDAQAFCGFYVAGGEASLFNDATQVSLLRHGTKTVLSMQNNYKGPAKGFAMVVPVPVVLQQEDVKTLPVDLFNKVDTLSAPRLVEYWEEDPCAQDDYRDFDAFDPTSADDLASESDNNAGGDPDGVVVEAEFAVGEYDVVVLSATEATGLESWLTTNNYNIPDGAAPIFNQYIQQGMYFFVAKVDPAKVTYAAPGEIVLSPLRFAYDSETFSLPIRLGMVNAKDEQDLIVYILSQDSRYEAANYPNTTIPTNLEVSKAVKEDFGSFYVKLFDQTVKDTPGAVVTEYSWSASGCDPCPGPVLDGVDLSTLGVDVVTEGDNKPGQFNAGWTLTRLHTRTTKGGLSEDLVFKKAPALYGGREWPRQGPIEKGSSTSSDRRNPTWGTGSQFQGRYMMRNRWEGAVECDDPTYGVWQGPPAGEPFPQVGSAVSPNSGGTTSKGASDQSLSELLREDVESIGLESSNKPEPRGANQASASASSCGTTQGGAIPGALLGLAGIAGALRLRRRRDAR